MVCHLRGMRVGQRDMAACRSRMLARPRGILERRPDACGERRAMCVAAREVFADLPEMDATQGDRFAARRRTTHCNCEVSTCRGVMSGERGDMDVEAPVVESFSGRTKVWRRILLLHLLLIRCGSRNAYKPPDGVEHFVAVACACRPALGSAVHVAIV